MPSLLPFSTAASLLRSRAGALALAVILGGVPVLNAADAPKPAPAKSAAQQDAAFAPGVSGPMQIALIMAQSVSRQLRGSRVIVVHANGNFQRVFEEDAALVIEPVRREGLRVGDMVAYLHPSLRTTVVQRLVKINEIEAGAGTELSRVVAVIYARKNLGMPQLAGAGAKKPSAVTSKTPTAAAAAR